MQIKKQNNWLNKIIISIIFIQPFVFFAQEDAFTNEITYQGDKVYYQNKPLTGWLFSEEDGVPNACDCTLKAKYANGLKNGFEKKWYSNGKPKEVSKYSNGVILSKTLYFSNGNIRKKETYANGTILTSTLYNKDGSKKGSNTINLPTQNNVLNSSGNTTPYVTTPTTQGDGTVNNTTFLLPQQGLQKTFYPNGKIKRIKFHKNGLLVKDSLFYDNATLHITKKYEDGELVHAEEYLKNNKLLKEENFKNNKKNGIQRKNFETGITNFIENYENGELVHKEIYNESSTLLKEENYKFGKKNGIQKEFDSDGNVILLQEYTMNVLTKTEKLTSKGKEITTINNIAKTKQYNTQNKLISLSFKDIKINKKDSIWILYNPITNFKTEETAYIKGFKTRYGEYKDNKRDGVWYFYWQNKKGETLKWYVNGTLTKTKKYTYSKQLKNNFKDGDVVFNYKTSTKETGNNYIILRNFKNEENAYIKRAKQTLHNVFSNHFIRLQNIDDVENEELYTIEKIENLAYKFNQKKEGSKKVVAYINVTIETKNVKTDKTTKESITKSPINSEHTKLNSLYTKDKEDAYKQTLYNFEQHLTNLLQKKYPIIGTLVKFSQQSTKEVTEVLVYFEKSKNIFEKDILIITDENNQIKAELKVLKVKGRIVSCKVKEGGLWLKTQAKWLKNSTVKKKKKS